MLETEGVESHQDDIVVPDLSPPKHASHLHCLLDKSLSSTNIDERHRKSPLVQRFLKLDYLCRNITKTRAYLKTSFSIFANKAYIIFGMILVHSSTKCRTNYGYSFDIWSSKCFTGLEGRKTRTYPQHSSRTWILLVLMKSNFQGHQVK